MSLSNKHLQEIIVNHRILARISSFFRNEKLHDCHSWKRKKRCILQEFSYSWLEGFCNYLTVLSLQAKQESMCFLNPSVNSKLLRTPTCLALNSTTTQNSYDPNEDVLEVVCKPIVDFLETLFMDTVDQDCSDTISDCKLRPAVCINCQDVVWNTFTNIVLTPLSNLCS